MEHTAHSRKFLHDGKTVGVRLAVVHDDGEVQLLRQLLLVLVCFVRESELNRMERRSDVNELFREERQNRFDLGEKPVRVYVSPRMRCKPEATRPWRIYQPAS